MYLKATVIARFDEDAFNESEEREGYEVSERIFEPGDTEAATAALRHAIINNVLGGAPLRGESVTVEVVTEPAGIAA